MWVEGGGGIERCVQGSTSYSEEGKAWRKYVAKVMMKIVGWYREYGRVDDNSQQASSREQQQQQRVDNDDGWVQEEQWPANGRVVIITMVGGDLGSEKIQDGPCMCIWDSALRQAEPTAVAAAGGTHTEQKHTHHTHKPWCAIVVAVLSLRRHHHHPTLAHRAVLSEALVDYGAGMASPGPRVTTWKDGRRSRLPFRVLHIIMVPAWTSPRSPIIPKAERDPSDGGVRQTAPLKKRRNRRPRY